MSRSIIDASALTPWAGVLRAAGAAAMAEGTGVVAKGSLNIKTTARRLAPKGVHLSGKGGGGPLYEASISYDLTSGPGWVEGEIGPVEGRRQRGLGNLLEYGSSNNPPHPHLEPALDEEEPRFYAAAEVLAASLVERFG